MKRTFTRLLLIFLINSISTFTNASSPVSLKICFSNRFDSVPLQHVSYQVFQASNTSYGYDILVNGKVLVHQPTIPCIQGFMGFRSKKDAVIVAAFVADKVRKGIMPPTVTLNEMKALRVKI